MNRESVPLRAERHALLAQDKVQAEFSVLSDEIEKQWAPGMFFAMDLKPPIERPLVQPLFIGW